MPSLTDIAFLMPVVFLFARMQGVRAMLNDGTPAGTIRTGEWILAHHQSRTRTCSPSPSPANPGLPGNGYGLGRSLDPPALGPGRRGARKLLYYLHDLSRSYTV